MKNWMLKFPSDHPPNFQASQRPTIIKVISIGHPAFLAGPPSFQAIYSGSPSQANKPNQRINQSTIFFHDP
jgi:hypothetical protein